LSEPTAVPEDEIPGDAADRAGADARVTAVLFDFASTLFAPRPTAELLANAAAVLGLELSEEESVELARRYLAAGVPGGPYPRVMPDHLASLYAQRDLSPHIHRAAYAGLLSSVAQPYPGLAEALYEEVLTARGWVPYTDARSVIDTLERRGIQVGLVSNIGFDLRPILRPHGFGDLADTCTLSYEVHAVKPDPVIFRAALQKVGDHPARTVMVGDDPSADGGASALGMTTLILPVTPPGTPHGLVRVVLLTDQPGMSLSVGRHP
jgi:HAD superfamily hydrolase (TIGR01509 family)